jgi:hypothetical protein
MIATRLRDAYLKQAAMEEGAEIMVKPSSRRACWRNVKLNFKPLEGEMEFGLAPTHLANFRIPTEGMLSLDFVSFSVPEAGAYTRSH